jgi:hypothetical protein
LFVKNKNPLYNENWKKLKVKGKDMTQVFSTTDYSQFKTYKSNRAVSSCENLEASILKKNKLDVNPIVVSHNYEIVDGQHRLEIAKKYNLPIFYIIDSGATEDDIAKLNSCQKTWQLKDYLHHFVKRCKTDYLFCQSIVKEFPISLTLFIDMFTFDTAKKRTRSDFKNGRLKLKYKKDHIEEMCKQFAEIRNMIPNLIHIRKSRNFDNALLTLIRNEKYDHDEMMRKITLYPDGLIEATKYNHKDLIIKILLDKVYNYRNQTKKLKV